MPDPAEEWRFSLSDETWYKIQSRISFAESRKESELASLIRKPDDDKLADVHTENIRELLAAHGIPALDEVYYPADLTSFLRFLEGVRRWLLCEKLPREAELIRRYCHWESTAAFECQCEMLVNADFNKWRSAAELKIAEQAKHSQGSIGEIANSWIFRLSSDPSSEPSEYPVNGDIRRVDVPDSAMEENNPADPEAKAIESGNNRQRDTHAKKSIPQELVRARYDTLTRHRNQKNGQSVAAFAHNVGASVTAVHGIVREDRNRYSDEKRDRLLRELGITLETWNSAEALKQVDWPCAPESRD
ncbi:MAG: hypothetical protein ACJ74Z_16060 [Bryobacteraceae bacterium]|jgi:ribosome-binding protein aMBF1 (putative translation factor)